MTATKLERFAGRRRSSLYLSLFILATINVILLYSRITAAAASAEQAGTNSNTAGRTLSKTDSSSSSGAGIWKKFTVVTQNNFTFTPQGAPVAGVFLTSQGAVSNLKLNQIIGGFNQACILPTKCLTCAQLELSYDCNWIVSLSLQGGRPGTITLQGSFSYPCFFGSSPTTTFPSPQYAVITGGTGIFRSLIGVVKIQPFTPPSFACPVPGNTAPILLQYTFYIKEVS